MHFRRSLSTAVLVALGLIVALAAGLGATNVLSLNGTPAKSAALVGRQAQAGPAAPPIETAPASVQRTPAAAAAPTAAPTATAAPLGADWARTRPNALGKVMILEYHLLGPTESRWTRSYANFWHDLNLLYDRGYRPINASDLVENHIDIPAGTSPVVLTFDDSSPMQFDYIQGPDGSWQVDPQSAVGMLERFHQLHPEWGLKGTFFVLPGADHPHDLFGQENLKGQKLQHLVSDGFEIGNHTFWHQRLDLLKSKAAVDEQLARAVQAVRSYLPNYNVRVLALPLGMKPKDPTWDRDGTWNGIHYHNEAVMRETGGPAVTPNSVNWDPYTVPRIQATNMQLDWEKVYLAYFDQHPEQRYVSSGDPHLVVFPANLASQYKPGPGAQEVQLPAGLAGQYRAYRIP
ncbi:MAG: polysaccharide deacetylase family protein [Chloroflexi bacterium]|nr:polysaccharide deacetylase family protein [Chloroflexota bacterium]MCL5109689.1 polysaccharide deacetylase family protein [Chloroflexota bacterium]